MRHSLFLIMLTLCPVLLRGQSQEMRPVDFYRHNVINEQRAMPLPYVREDDVLWEHTIWRTIDFREKFNQFFFYPIDRKGVHGRKNFAYTLWDAIMEGRLPLYEDDDLLIPLDAATFIDRLTRPDTLVVEIEDEEDEDMIEYRSVLVPREFESEDVLQLRLKEAWYLDKQTTGQYVRILALGLTQDYYKDVDGDREFMGTVTLFWIPMMSTTVRNLLMQREVYYIPNLTRLPTWERIFTERYFDSFIYRETNVYNRTIASYLTGTEAILESERIEEFLLEISEDQWEW